MIGVEELNALANVTDHEQSAAMVVFIRWTIVPVPHAVAPETEITS